MVQEDKGLVMRGIFLLALIGALVTFVLVILFWRAPQPAPKTLGTPPEHLIPLAIIPSATSFPGSVSWGALVQLSQALPSAPGFEIRYNAAATLARRGSPDVPWPLIREMLDENQQLRNQRVRLPDGSETYDEVAARAFTIIALKAVATWHEKQEAGKIVPPPHLLDIYDRVDQLARSEHKELKDQAERTRALFFRTKK